MSEVFFNLKVNGCHVSYPLPTCHLAAGSSVGLVYSLFYLFFYFYVFFGIGRFNYKLHCCTVTGEFARRENRNAIIQKDNRKSKRKLKKLMNYVHLMRYENDFCFFPLYFKLDIFLRRSEYYVTRLIILRIKNYCTYEVYNKFIVPQINFYN